MGSESVVNGLDVSAFREALEAVRGTPGASKGPKAARVRWLEGLKLRAYARDHVFEIDEPTHLTGEDTAPNAMEYVLGALGACYLTGFVLNASLRGIDLYNAEVVLNSTQENVFNFLGLSDDPHPGFDDVVAKLYVQADADDEVLREIWERTVKTSPVGNSLERVVPVRAEMVVVE